MTGSLVSAMANTAPAAQLYQACHVISRNSKVGPSVQFGAISGLGWESSTISGKSSSETLNGSKPLSTTRRQRATLKVQAAADLKTELKEFALAERRWMTQITEGKVKNLTPKEAGYTYQLADYVLLDVRPTFEREKGWVKDSVWIPAFDTDKSVAPGVLASKASMFLMGGWWSGGALTKRNERFMADVVSKIPKSANIIVACQKGLRSLAACEHLYKAGYRNLYWINGGFEAATDEDFEREGPQPLKYAGLGGVSEFLGWTDIQRHEAAKQGLQYRAVFFLRLIGLLLGVDVAFLALQQLVEAAQSLGN